MAETLIGIVPLHERVLVGIYDDGDTSMTLGGKTFYLLDDSSADKTRDIHTKHQGVRPRWAMVLGISDAVQNAADVKVGDKVLLDQLTWSRGMNAHINGGEIAKVWSIPVGDILLKSEEGFTEQEKAQLDRLYENWREWTPVTV